jgi:hypothetical protein
VVRTLLKEREERTEVMGRGGKRRKQLLNNLKEARIPEFERGSTWRTLC